MLKNSIEENVSLLCIHRGKQEKHFFLAKVNFLKDEITRIFFPDMLYFSGKKIKYIQGVQHMLGDIYLSVSIYL